MERSTTERIRNSPGVGTKVGTVLYETEVAKGNGGEYDGGMFGTGAVWSAVRVIITTSYHL